MDNASGQLRRVSMAYLLGFSNKPFKDSKPPKPPPPPSNLNQMMSSPGGVIEWAASDGRKGKLTGIGRTRSASEKGNKSSLEKDAKNSGQKEEQAKAENTQDSDNPHGFTAEEDKRMLDWKAGNATTAWKGFADEIGRQVHECRERFKQIKPKDEGQSAAKPQDSGQQEQKLSKKEKKQNKANNQKAAGDNTLKKTPGSKTGDSGNNGGGGEAPWGEFGGMFEDPKENKDTTTKDEDKPGNNNKGVDMWGAATGNADNSGGPDWGQSGGATGNGNGGGENTSWDKTTGGNDGAVDNSWGNNGGGNDGAADTPWGATAGDNGAADTSWNNTGGDNAAADTPWQAEASGANGGWDQTQQATGNAGGAAAPAWNADNNSKQGDSNQAVWGLPATPAQPEKLASKIHSVTQPNQQTSHRSNTQNLTINPVELEIRPDDIFSAEDLRAIARILQQDSKMVWDRVSWRFRDKTGRALPPEVFEKKITGRVEGKGSERSKGSEKGKGSESGKGNEKEKGSESGRRKESSARRWD
ncbi:hypothetical protein GQ44DRAFT_778111 [Phaeosphaeriaceae sp. PMI808]|nr:hypothetical protein GQ44DRAFT_778111 [Phaeosphaeriaceae sp. PMI808]